MIKKILKSMPFLAFGILASCSGTPSLEVVMPAKYDGQSIEIINYLDSTILATAVLDGNSLTMLPDTKEPVFTAIMVDGKTKAFYITEGGTSLLTDSVSVPTGTPLNDKFSRLIEELDSVEKLDDMNLYLNFVEKQYNDNKENPIGDYFGLELLRFSEPQKIDSLTNILPARLKDSPKAKKFIEAGQLRAETSPGKPYKDFQGENASGQPLALSSFVNGKDYVLVDFWASWCPYCVNEMPEIAELYKEWNGKGLQIVGVAVRDLPEDTKAAVEKFNITWPVIYNAQRKPYDLYGISGIPEHILIDPNGTIVLRGETIPQINEWLKQNLTNSNSNK